jgi:hypothetical protein
MPGVQHFDFTAWPIWLLAILVVVNIFKEQIGSFFPAAITDFFRFRAERKRDNQEHTQLLEEREQQRKSWREEQWVELILRKDAWLQEHLEKQLAEIEKGNNRIVDAITEVQNTTRRTNDILATIHVALSRRHPDG